MKAAVAAAKKEGAAAGHKGAVRLLQRLQGDAPQIAELVKVSASAHAVLGMRHPACALTPLRLQPWANSCSSSGGLDAMRPDGEAATAAMEGGGRSGGTGRADSSEGGSLELL